MKLGHRVDLSMADQRGGLPLAGGQSDTYGGSTRYQGWQRALEQAELADWFKGGSSDGENRDQNLLPRAVTQAVPPAHAPARERSRQQGEASSSYDSNPAPDCVGTWDTAPSASDHPEEGFSGDGGEFVQAYGATRETAQPGASSSDNHMRGDVTAGQRPMTTDARAAISQRGLSHNAALDVDGQDLMPLQEERAVRVSRTGPSRSFVAQLRQALTASMVGPSDVDVPVAARGETEAARQSLPGVPAPGWISNDVPLDDTLQSPEEMEAPSTAGKQEATTAAEFDPAVRVHVEWTERGVRVWLGINCDESSALPEIQRQLDRMLAESGHQLLSLVCNGRQVTDATPNDWARRGLPARLSEGRYQQAFQGGGCSAGQAMFHLYEQVER